MHNKKPRRNIFKIIIHFSLNKLLYSIVPNVPSDFKIESITTTSMIIQWKSPEETELYGSPESYLLNLLSPSKKQYKLNVTNKSLKTLKPCKTYCFNIMAINIAGKSLPSDKVCRNTKPIFDNILSLSSTRHQEVSVLITWNYFNKNDCNVKFLIKYFIKFQENSFRMTNTTMNNTVLQDLSKDQYYIVNVTPEFDGLEGQVSNNLEFHTIQVPTTPKNIRMRSRTRNSISIQWNQLENKDSKHFNKYEIKQNGTLKAFANKENYKLNDLLPCTRYCFTISASNYEGKSEESEPFCASTNAGPTEIEVLQTEVDKSNFKLIRWQHRNMYKCLYEFKIEYLMKPNISQKPFEITKNENLRISSSEFNQILSVKITPVYENEIEEFSVNINLHSTNKRKKKSMYLIYLFIVLLLLASLLLGSFLNMLNFD